MRATLITFHEMMLRKRDIMRAWFSIQALSAFLLIAIVPLHADWVKISSGPRGIRVLLASSSSSGPLASAVFAGGDSGFFRSSDAGAAWIRKSSGLPSNPVVSLAWAGADLYAGTLGGGVFRSVDTGSTWVGLNSGLPNSNIYGMTFWNTSLFAGTDSGVFRLTAGGTNWQAMNTGLTHKGIRALAFRTGTTSALYAGTNGGGVFQSTDGMNWAAAGTGLTSGNVRCFLSQDAWLVATDSGVFYRATATSWAFRNNGLANKSVRGLIEIPLNVGIAATDSGVFRGVDYMATGSPFFKWTTVNEGLGDMNVRAVTFSPPSSAGSAYLVAAAETGIWRRGGTELMVGDAILPADRKGNYFGITSGGSISFKLSTPMTVSLEAFKPSGQRAATVSARRFSAGTHVLIFSTTLPDGVYLYRLKAADVAQTRTIVIAR